MFLVDLLAFKYCYHTPRGNGQLKNQVEPIMFYKYMLGF